MPKLDLVSGGAPPSLIERFELAYVDEHGEQRVRLTEALPADVRWLAGYRHPRHHLPDVADALHAAFADSAPLLDGAGHGGWCRGDRRSSAGSCASRRPAAHDRNSPVPADRLVRVNLSFPD